MRPRILICLFVSHRHRKKKTSTTLTLLSRSIGMVCCCWHIAFLPLTVTQNIYLFTLSKLMRCPYRLCFIFYWTTLICSISHRFSLLSSHFASCDILHIFHFSFFIMFMSSCLSFCVFLWLQKFMNSRESFPVRAAALTKFSVGGGCDKAK